jgi:hypothetical protein
MTPTTYRRPLPLKEAAHILGVTERAVLVLSRARAPASPRGGPPRTGGTTGSPLDHGEHPTRLVLTTLGGTSRTRRGNLAAYPRVSQTTLFRERNRLALMEIDGPHPSTSLPRAAQALGLPSTPAGAVTIGNMLAPSAGVIGEDKLRRGHNPHTGAFDAPGVDIEALRWMWEAKARRRFDYLRRKPRPRGVPPARLPTWPWKEPGFRVWHHAPIHPDDLPLRL